MTALEALTTVISGIMIIIFSAIFIGIFAFLPATFLYLIWQAFGA